MGFAAYTVQILLAVPPEFTNVKLIEEPQTILKAPNYSIRNMNSKCSCGELAKNDIGKERYVTSFIGPKFQQMYWILGRKSNLSTENKLLMYKTILKPIWTYAIPLCGTASNSNLEILHRYQNKSSEQQ
jgi:hypothetical protein